MNILTAAGIAQINEPILPQNGERIWGGLGVVTFNQASQYIEEPNPDAPITPPDCVNCGGGIPPEVPPEEPEVVRECLSTCPENQFVVYFYNYDGTTPNISGSFNTYDEAMDYMTEICTSTEFKQPFLDAQQARLDAYNLETNEYIQEFLSFDTWTGRMASINFRECFSTIKYSDGTQQQWIAGAQRYTYSSPTYKYMYWYGIINYKRTDKNTGKITNLSDYWYMGYIYFRYTCAVCEPTSYC